jgi:hypothetical protein
MTPLILVMILKRCFSALVMTSTSSLHQSLHLEQDSWCEWGSCEELSVCPCLTHVIEQVSGIQFPTDSSHKLLKIANKTSITATKELKKATATSHASGSRLASSSFSWPTCLDNVVLVLNASMTCKRGSTIWSSGLVFGPHLRRRLCLPVIL